jgi:hypothetical protein
MSDEEDNIRQFDENYKEQLIEEDEYTASTKLFDDYDTDIQKVLFQQLDKEKLEEELWILRMEEYDIRSVRYSNLIEKIKSLIKIDNKNIETYQNMLKLIDYLLFKGDKGDIDTDLTIHQIRGLINKTVFPFIFDDTIINDVLNTVNFIN